MRHLFLGACLLFLTGAAKLPEPAANEVAACIADVLRLCSEHIPDRARIVACLAREHGRGELSAACRAVLDARRGHR
jgi:hypothetical protein